MSHTRFALVECRKWLQVWALALGTRYYRVKKQVKDANAGKGLGAAALAFMLGACALLVGAAGDTLRALQKMAKELGKGAKRA